MCRTIVGGVFTMNVYYIKGFPGHYPVGTAAVVVARDRLHAFDLLNEKLTKEHFLPMGLKDINPEQFIQLDTNSAHCVVLQDGDY